MTNNSRVRAIKHAQKESLIAREISRAFQQITLDEPQLAELSITHSQLSPDKGTCYIYFYTPGGEERFRELAGQLILYKPSIRHALAQSMNLRYTPELLFKYDKQREKQQRIEDILDQQKKEGRM